MRLRGVNEKITIDQIPENFEALKRCAILLYAKRLTEFEYSDYVTVFFKDGQPLRDTYR
jgi:hypothetical protein